MDFYSKSCSKTYIVKVLYEQKSCQLVFVNSLTCPPSSDQVESFKLIQRIQPLDSSQMRISLSPIFMRPLQDMLPKFANNSPPDDQANRVDQLRSSEFVWIIRLKQWTGYSDECVEIIISIPIIRIINRSCCWLLGSLSRDKCRERRRFCHSVGLPWTLRFRAWLEYLLDFRSDPLIISLESRFFVSERSASQHLQISTQHRDNIETPTEPIVPIRLTKQCLAAKSRDAATLITPAAC